MSDHPTADREETASVTGIVNGSATSLPRAVPMYLGETGEEFFAWYHRAHPTGACAGVVLCPAIGYDAIPSHRTLRHLAERLAGAGIDVLRIDYPGTGDSTGSDEDPDRVAAWTGAIVRAVAEFRRRLPGAPIYLVGMRLGGLLAALAATREEVDGVVLWAAPPSGRRFVREMQALGLATDPDDPHGAASTGIEAAGFKLTDETAQTLRGVKLQSLEVVGSPRMLWFDRDDLPEDRAAADRLRERGSEVSYHRPPGFTSMMTEPHYTVVPDDAITAIADWIRAGIGRDPFERKLDVSPPSLTLRVDGKIVEEQPFRFGPDERLFGVLTAPADERATRRPAVVLLNAGSVLRIGPNRMYVALARRWAAAGVTTLRMDFGGIGDSVVAAGARENNPYSAQAHDDILAALDALRHRRGADRFVLGGVCSGAYSAFTSGRTAPGVVQCLMVNPLTFYWKDGMSLDTPTFKHYLAVKHYQRSVRSWASWKKLLRGGVNLPGIARLMLERGRRLTSARLGAIRHAIGLDRHDEDNLRRDLQHLADRGVAIGFVFSEGDPGFDLLFVEAGGTVNRLRKQGRLTLKVISGADHTFTPFSARERLMHHLTAMVTPTRRSDPT